MVKLKSVLLVIVMGTVIGAIMLLRQQAPEKQHPELTIAVSMTPLSAPLYVAAKKHYFSDLGLNIKLVSCSGGVACASMLFDGEADLATASESVVMFNSFKHDDFSVLTSFVESDNDLKLLALADFGNRKMNDLKGKKVGVIKASASEFYLDSLMIINNLTPSDIEKVYLLPSQLISSLFEQRVDAISAWEPYGFQVQKMGNGSVVNLGLPGVYQLSFNLLASRELSNDQRSSILILQALNRSINWINDHPEEALKIVSDELRMDPEELQWSWPDFIFRLALGNSLLSNLQMQARWALNLQLVEGNPPDFRQYLETETFRAALGLEE